MKSLKRSLPHSRVAALEATLAGATLVLGQFSPLVDRQQARHYLGRDASPSVREQVSHLQGGQSWQQWHGLPQTSCLLLCIFLLNKSIGCTGGMNRNVDTNSDDG